MAQPATNPKIDELRSRLKAEPKSRLFYQLAEDRFLLIALSHDTRRVLKAQLPALLGRVREQVVFDGGRHLDAQLRVVEARRLDPAARASGPVLAERLHGEPAELALAA